MPRMRGHPAYVLGILAALAAACAGASTEPKQATDEYGVPSSRQSQEEDSDDVDQPKPTKPAARTEGDEDADQKAPKGGEPEFKDGMSVRQAMDAVPQGMERVNIEEEILSQPLADPKTYEPCKLRPGMHFKLKVAIWNGRAVGIDITAPDQKLGECIRQQIQNLEWRKKVKSLNTVEYQM